MGNNSLDWKIKNGIGFLLLNQPPANPMTIDFFNALGELTGKIKSIRNLKGIIISGQGRHFSSGADLKELTYSINHHFINNQGNPPAGIPEFMLKNLESFQFFNELNIPVVAAIKGVCIGSAFELALHCHFRLCTKQVVVGLPESTYGLIPGLGGISQLLKILPKVTAMEMACTGSTFNSAGAYKNKLADRVIGGTDLLYAAEILVSIASTNYRKYNKKEYLQQFDHALSNLTITP